MAKRKRGEAHVRFYRHEIDSLAFKSLSGNACALLIQFRALYNGRDNKIHMSVREAMRRTGLCQSAAQHAIDDLLDRGFIRLLAKGTFHHKVRHASVYQLTNEPPDDRDGSVPTRDFMRWHPKKHGIGIQYSAVSESNTAAPAGRPENGQNCIGIQYSETTKTPPSCIGIQYTDMLPGGALVSAGVPKGSKRVPGSPLRLVTP